MNTNISTTPGLTNSPCPDIDFLKLLDAELKSIELKLEKCEKAHSGDIRDHEHQADPPKKKKHRSLFGKIKHFFKKVGHGIKNAFKAVGNALKAVGKALKTLATQILSMLPMLLTGPIGMIMGLGSMLMNTIMAIKANAMQSKYMKESAAQTAQIKSMEMSMLSNYMKEPAAQAAQLKSIENSIMSNYLKETTQPSPSTSSKSTSPKSTNSDIV